MEIPGPDEILAMLEPHIEKGRKEKLQNFSKEAVNSLGIRTAKVRDVAKLSYADVKHLDAETLFDAAEALLREDLLELHTVGLDWTFRHRKHFRPEHFERFKGWLRDYVRSWMDCDHICTTVIGDFLMRFPEFLPRVKAWANSPNRWFRRASAVALILGLRKKGIFLKELFATAETMLSDQDDLVQKGYGWALKVGTKFHEAEVFRFVMAHRKDMPRTALRYAIEKMSKEMKAEAMKRI